MRHLATIGLGSNLPSHAGPPEQIILAAMHDLSTAGIIVARSSLYRTEPVEYAEQPPFVNAVLQLETDLDPQQLLARLLAIERDYGRERTAAQPKGPRTLDLDLLLVDDCILHKPGLTLPHPALAQRRFVLAPLAEIAPSLRHPVLQATIAELLARLPDEDANRVQSVRKLQPADKHL